MKLKAGQKIKITFEAEVSHVLDREIYIMLNGSFSNSIIFNEELENAEIEIIEDVE